MWRKLTLILAVLIAITCAMTSDMASAQANAGAGNQSTISNRPRIDIIEKDITVYKTEKLTFITANADLLEHMAETMLGQAKLLYLAIQGFTGAEENDPFVATFADKRSLQPGVQCFSGCAAGQKMHWDGNNWRCMDAVLPICPSGQVFSATTCSCINPCPSVTMTFPPNGPQTFPQAPDSTGACCFPGQINPGTGLCRTCPDAAFWDPRDNMCRCQSNGSPAPEGTVCSNCQQPNLEDPNGVCCSPSQMQPNGYCRPPCQTLNHQHDINGVCCAPSTMVPPNIGVCPPDPHCPAGTIPVDDQCRCPSGQLIEPNGTCSACPSGQLPDNNGACCPIEDLEYGSEGDQCMNGSSLSCAATTINNCGLPSFSIQPNQSQAVNGICASGYVPTTGSTCSGTCQSTQDSANYAINVGCTENTVACTPSVRWMSGFQCPFQGRPGNGCNPVGATDGVVECSCTAETNNMVFEMYGAYRCNNGTWTPEPGWMCHGHGYDPNTETCGDGICNDGYEMVNGQCLQICDGEHEIRNGSGQCVCEANYERWPNNATGECIPIPPEIKYGCFIDTAAYDRPSADGSCESSGCTSTNAISWSIGTQLTGGGPGGTEGDNWTFPGQWASRFDVTWTQSGCTQDCHNGTHVSRLTVRDTIKNTTQNLTITAVKQTRQGLPHECPPQQ